MASGGEVGGGGTAAPAAGGAESRAPSVVGVTDAVGAGTGTVTVTATPSPSSSELDIDALAAAVKARHSKVWMIVSNPDGSAFQPKALRRYCRMNKLRPVEPPAPPGNGPGTGTAASVDADGLARDANALLTHLDAEADKRRRTATFRASAKGKVASARWKLLRAALTGKDEAGAAGSGGAPDTPRDADVSVRRHNGFRLFEKTTRDAVDDEASASSTGTGSGGGGSAAVRFLVDEYTVWPAPAFLTAGLASAGDARPGTGAGGGAAASGPERATAAATAVATAASRPSLSPFGTRSLKMRVRRRAPGGRVSLAELASHHVSTDGDSEGSGGRAGVDNTGNVCVWPAEEVLTAFCLRFLPRRFVSKRAVCEIGAGMTGMAGYAVATAVGPAFVAVTDGNATAAANLAHCAAMNIECGSISRRTGVTSAQLLWDRSAAGAADVRALVERIADPGAPAPALAAAGGASAGTPADAPKHFDLVIGADCLFFVDFHVDLLVTCARLLGVPESRLPASLLDGAAGTRAVLPDGFTGDVETVPASHPWTPVALGNASGDGASRPLVVFMAPRRGDSLARFVQLARDSGLFDVAVFERYDDAVWRQHGEFVAAAAAAAATASDASRDGSVVAPYEADIHYPLLVQMVLK